MQAAPVTHGAVTGATVHLQLCKISGLAGKRNNKQEPHKTKQQQQRSWEATAFQQPNLVLHVEVRLHMLIVELDGCHRAVLVVGLLLIPELPAECLWRVAQASTHYSEYLPREANSCELAKTHGAASLPQQCHQ